MAPLTRLAADDWVAVLREFASSLEAHGVALDRLDEAAGGNGDTGVNLASVASAVSVAVSAAPQRDLSSCASAVGGAAAGGRGSSGRLLGAFLEGASDAARNHDTLDATAVALALEAGAEAMRRCADDVLGGVRAGSVVTVAEAVAAAALSSTDDGALLAPTVVAAADAGLDALEATPEVVPSLAEAGVVDPGAAGFLVFVEALVGVVHGDAGFDAGSAFAVDTGADGDLDGDTADQMAAPLGRYVIRLQLDAPIERAEFLATVWTAIGDDVSIERSPAVPSSENADRWVATVTTDDIGAAVEAAIAAGRPSGISVSDRITFAAHDVAPDPAGGERPARV